MVKPSQVPRRVVAFIDGVSEWTGKAVSFLILITVGAAVIEIVARFVFNRPTIWAYELEMFTAGIVYVFVGAFCLRYRMHVRVDIIYLTYSRKTQRILNLAVFFPLIVFMAGTLTYTGFDYAWTSFQLHERSYSAWGPLLWPVKMTLPIGAALLVCQAIADFLRELYDLGGD